MMVQPWALQEEPRVEEAWAPEAGPREEAPEEEAPGEESVAKMGKKAPEQLEE
jgi:hypothetical protein